MRRLLILLCVTSLTLGCQGTGSSDANVLSPAISAKASFGSSSGGCINMTNNASCTIQLTYNTMGISGVLLNATPNPLPTSITGNGVFTSSFGVCQTDVTRATNNQQYTCSVTILYTSGNATDINLAFTLGNTTSNAIRVSGN